MERTLLRLPRTLSRRALATVTTRPFTTTHCPLAAFNSGPSPPRLPKDEQALFEKLQSQSTGAFSSPRPDSAQATPSPSPSTSATPPPASHDLRARINQSPDAATRTGPGDDAQAAGSAPGDELHPNVRRGAPPEFEGDVNPRTGEVGGPKNEPLRWGHAGDWSYNGRVTDF